VDRLNGPLKLVRLYGILEFLIGGYAVVVPFLIAALKPLYAWLYSQLLQHFLFYNALTFAACSLTLAVPVLCMGATLPLLCRYQVRELRTVGTSTGLLYALNTAGAACGALLGGVLLVPLFGVWGTLVSTALVNVLIGVIAFRLARRASSASGVTMPEATPAAAGELAIAEDGNKRIIAGALLIFGVSGFCAMSYEVIWTKLLSLIVGPTNYSFTIILVTFIFGLALGSFIFGRLGDRTERPETLLIATQIAAALSALTISQLLGGSQLLFAKLLLVYQDRFAVQNVMKALLLFGFLVFPTVCLGAAFPLVGRICSRHLRDVGRSIGLAYAINSAGAVTGSFAAGFLLIPLLGKEAGLSLVIALQLLTALAGVAILWTNFRLPLLLRIAGVAVAVAGLVAAWFVPQWNHLILASSKYHRLENLKPLCQSVGWFRALFHGAQILARSEPHELLFYGDGIGGFTTVCRTVDALGVPEYWMANSGKFDASSRGDMNTEVLLAHVPMFFHPQARLVLVIGLASGVTTGEALRYPVERVDVVEINEQAAKASAFFGPWNNRVLDDPRTRLIIQDARAHLSLARSRYDVIISEPSNPWMAGCASLFTRDFFQQAKERLSAGGCFVQWLHAYQIDWESVELVGRTFLDVFPDCMLVSTQPTKIGSDYLLVGFKEGGDRPAERIRQDAPPLRESPNLVLKDPRLLYRLVVSDNCAGIFGPGPLNTDNWPLLEFQAPRQMYRSRADASRVIKRLVSSPHLDENAKAYVDHFAGSVEAHLDFAQFALSIFEPFAGMFDASQATAAQKARFAEMMLRYCESNQVELELIADKELRARCVARQLEIMQTRTTTIVTNEAACLYHAELLKAAGQNEAALEFYRRSAQLNPFNVQALNETGILLCQRGQVAEGMEHFRKVLAIDPNQAEAHVNLATAYYTSGNATLAELHFKEALRIDPGLPEARDGIRLLQTRKRH
jgi:spermidine synthase